jgi:hypothetical protein
MSPVTSPIRPGTGASHRFWVFTDGRPARMAGCWPALLTLSLHQFGSGNPLTSESQVLGFFSCHVTHRARILLHRNLATINAIGHSDMEMWMD